MKCKYSIIKLDVNEYLTSLYGVNDKNIEAIGLTTSFGRNFLPIGAAGTN